MLKTIAMNKIDEECCCHRANSSRGRATINKYNKQMSDGGKCWEEKKFTKGAKVAT